MRILRLIPYFNDGFGGPVNHAKMLTRELERAGHETVIFTSNLADKSGEVSPSFANGFENIEGSIPASVIDKEKSKILSLLHKVREIFLRKTLLFVITRHNNDCLGICHGISIDP